MADGEWQYRTYFGHTRRKSESESYCTHYELQNIEKSPYTSGLNHNDNLTTRIIWTNKLSAGFRMSSEGWTHDYEELDDEDTISLP